MLGYHPVDKRQKVEVSNEMGFCKAYDTLKEAVEYSGIPNSLTIKYALDHERPFLWYTKISFLIWQDSTFWISKPISSNIQATQKPEEEIWKEEL